MNQDMLLQHPAGTGEKKGDRPIFTVEHLRYRYQEAKEYAVDGIDFTIGEGEIFGFLGPSGAGKSTTQKILIRLLQDYEGQITYRGKDLKRFGNEFYEEIGVGFEMPISFSKLTAMENLSFFQKLYRQTVEVEPLMRQVGLWPDKDKKVGEYSKGMKMRLNFVRALLNAPKMLFLDEPTNGLDPVNARILKDLVLDFRTRGGTVFLTSHIMSDVDELCDRVAFIAQGKLAEMDSPRNLKLKYGKRVVTVEYKEDGATRTEVFPMEAIKTPPFHHLLATREIETIHSGETTLEDIFPQVVGVQLHE
jgi:fluoroquinolone transport system ATP-binding protein